MIVTTHALVNVLVALIVLLVVWYVVKTGAQSFGIPEPIPRLVGIVLGLVWLIYALRAFGILTP